MGPALALPQPPICAERVLGWLLWVDIPQNQQGLGRWTNGHVAPLTAQQRGQQDKGQGRVGGSVALGHGRVGAPLPPQPLL